MVFGVVPVLAARGSLARGIWLGARELVWRTGFAYSSGVVAPKKEETETLKESAVVGLPEIRPLLRLMDRPVGSPVALKRKLSPSASSAFIVKVTLFPSVPV